MGAESFGIDENPPPVDEVIANRAGAQHGVFSVRQVFDAGGDSALIHRRVRARRWERAEPGVLRLRGAQPTWHQHMMGATLSAGDGALASHRAAAWLHRLDGIERPPELELSVPRGRRYRRHRAHQMRDVLPADASVVDGIPCTSVLRTLCDLAAVVDFETLERAVECALRRRLVSFKQLTWRAKLLARRGRNGTAEMLRLLRLRGDAPPTGSDLETRILQLLRRHGVRLPQRQYPVIRRNGRKAFIDCAYPDLMIAIELDGSATHGFLQAPSDRARQNDLVLLGWKVLRFSWDDVVHRPDDVIEALGAALGFAGRSTRSR